MPMRRVSTGGKAEAAGGNYETLVAAWYCARVLVGTAAQPLFDLPSSARLVAVSCQTGEPVDDVNCETSDGGMIFVQAKRTVTLSPREDSALASAIDQFVRQSKAWAEETVSNFASRPLDDRLDRLVLATRSGSSSKITEVLPRLLRGLRDRPALQTLSSVQTSGQESEVAEIVEAHVKRSWRLAHGAEPTPAEIGSLLRLVWVQTSDVEIDGRDRLAALDLMRGSVLSDPTQAGVALSELATLCARLRAERSGTDLSALQAALDRSGIRLVVLPDYRADVEALRRWTRTRLQRAPRFTRLLESDPTSTLERAAWLPFQTAVDGRSFLVVGEPGSGKSGLTYRLASTLDAAGSDVVFIPVDLLNIESFAALQGELGISRSLGEVLQNWPGVGRGMLVVDALDAARKLETQTILREAIDEVIRDAGGRWSVVASVRRYDLRQGTEWRRMFRGPPVTRAFSDPEFSAVSHIAVTPLADDEIAQTTSFLPSLHYLFDQANPQLRKLLRNIFNLHLLADLLDQGVVSSELASIRTQSELLQTYWRHRVQRDDDNHDVRELALTAILRQMISTKSLRVFRSDVRPNADLAALVDLERHDILRAEEEERGANEDVILFSHHVLFDYAVARLIFRMGRDPRGLVAVLRADRALTLMVGPSLTMALNDVWNSDSSRQAFWDLAFALGTEKALPAAAHLAAPMVAAESASTLDDLVPLISALGQPGPQQAVAEGTMQNLVGALLVRSKAGSPVVGPAAGPWMEFAEALSGVGTDATMLMLRPVMALGTADASLLTSSQLVAAGIAARRLLEFGLSHEQRHGLLVIAAIEAVSETIASDVAASSKLLRRVIEPEHLAAFGYEELRWLARHVVVLARSDVALVVAIYEAAYGFEDSQSDTKTSIGNSGILPLTSNRRQDYQGAWHLLGEAAPTLLRQFPAEGSRAIARAMQGYFQRAHPPYDGEPREPQAFQLGGATAHYIVDHSHIWYRGGVRGLQDGPALLTKFDAWLNGLAAEPGGPILFQAIVDVMASENGLAIMWASLFVAGAEHPADFAAALVPLSCATPIMEGLDTRHQVGLFLTAAYPHLDTSQRESIERAMLSLSEPIGERAKKVLSGCIPENLVATSEMRDFRDSLRASGEESANPPPYQITTSSRPFDTDAYLASEGVTVDDAVSSRLRSAMKAVEELPRQIDANSFTLEDARSRLVLIDELRRVLHETDRASIHARLYGHAEGVLAEAAARTALAPNEVIGDADIRRRLQSVLLSLVSSENPEFDATHEEDFHESLHWGGPSARTSAAQGLICLVRADQQIDREAMAAIHRLARDPVCHVRLQIVQNLYLLRTLEPEWMWSELEGVVAHEPTRGVVGAAIEAAAKIAWVDVPRVIALSKAVLTRYADEQGAGMEERRVNASMLIADIYIWNDNEEAKEFADQLMECIVSNPGLISQLIARYAGNLLIGSTTDRADTDNIVRLKTVDFYKRALDIAMGEADRLSGQFDIEKFNIWSAEDQETFRAMFRVSDEIAIRIYSASGANGSASSPILALTPERVRFYREVRPLLEKLADVFAVNVAHYLVQALEALVPIDPPGVFALIARSVRASEKGGYTVESMAADLIVRIVHQYLAEHREVFADPDRQSDLMDCLDGFAQAGWPSAQALMFNLGDIWR